MLAERFERPLDRLSTCFLCRLGYASWCGSWDSNPDWARFKRAASADRARAASPQGVLTPYLRLERAASRPLDDGAWKRISESNRTARLQRPRYPPGPSAEMMEAGQGIEPRFRRSERRVLPLNEPAKWCPAKGSNPHRPLTRRLHCHYASRAGVRYGCWPHFFAVTERRVRWFTNLTME